jgi:prepilin peptidase CpaA
MPATPTVALTMLFISLCIVTDLRSRRIPNALTLPGIGVGLTVSAAAHGASGLGMSGLGALLALALLVGPFALGGIGGGDVKMMAAVGSLVGPSALLASLAAGLILGGLVAVGVLWRRGRLAEKLGALGAMLHAAALMRSLAPLHAGAPDQATVALPYSLPLGLGTAIALAMRTTGGL